MAKQKKRRRIWLIVLAAVLILLIGLFLWQRENIMALYRALTMDSETIAQTLEEKRNSHHKAREEEYGLQIPVRPASTAECDDLLNGRKTVAEVKEARGVGQQEYDESRDGLIKKCMEELYAYKADVMGVLGGYKQEALDQWKALPKKERTEAKKASIAGDGMEKCVSYEITVDGKVTEILDVYRGKMKAIGEQTKPIDDLWFYYCDEKEAEKTYYMDQYLK